MLEIGQSIPLPSDPKQLTRELVMMCCPNPEVIIREFVRLAAQPQIQHTPAATRFSESQAEPA